MFPLKERKVIRGCQDHINAGLGCAVDYVAPVGTLVYAPFSDGVITIGKGFQGGNWLYYTRANGDVIQFAHLSKYIVISGKPTEGTPIALTGNTGKLTTGPHKHIQIFRNGKRINPETYLWDSLSMNRILGFEGDSDVYEEVRPFKLELLVDGDTYNGIRGERKTVWLPMGERKQYRKVGTHLKHGEFEVITRFPEAEL